MASIRERSRADGSIKHEVLWRDSDTGKQTSYGLSSSEEALRFKRLIEANGNSLTAVEEILQKISIGGPTVAENMQRHIELLTSAGPDQIKRYGSAIKNHFSGRLGKLPVAAVEHEDVVMWIKYMQGKTYKGEPLSAKTIANHHGLLSASMETAMRLKHRTDNPCRGIKLPKDTATEEKMYFMTAQASLAVVNSHPDRYQVFVSCLRATGARFGEVTAFYADDFDLNGAAPSVRVERAWKRDENNRFYIGPPKTKKSRRTISLPPSFVKDVRPLVEATDPGQHVFHTTYGGPIRHSTFWQFWNDAIETLKYPKDDRPRIHDMRHTHASLMLAGGMSIYELSRRLGHESIQTTIDRYSHLVPDAHFRAIDIAEKALEA
ncbi:tyrosine-type recombinase/integrase [Arthrobacter sp. FW306-2-2C-D06B]|uniref:tyrosine-type recombinase/integrase n=1 Tax=Arthrobacter sp. FW306-2-2C-D06B TaxID=2879618 RepID=UPI001F1C935F|nr:site-specific integrase [Arthrobacter sp. FW306-2-2C-D06B]UKA59134.1 site-specific integrase [Arthrobacter sp. FW306-2-2C-D06B]